MSSATTGGAPGVRRRSASSVAEKRGASPDAIGPLIRIAAPRLRQSEPDRADLRRRGGRCQPPQQRGGQQAPSDQLCMPQRRTVRFSNVRNSTFSTAGRS